MFRAATTATAATAALLLCALAAACMLAQRATAQEPFFNCGIYSGNTEANVPVCVNDKRCYACLTAYKTGITNFDTSCKNIPTTCSTMPSYACLECYGGYKCGDISVPWCPPKSSSAPTLMVAGCAVLAGSFAVLLM